MARNNDPLSTALYIHQLTGANVLPNSQGSKAPRIKSWTPWQTTKQTEADIKNLGWQPTDRVGVISGGVGRLCCLDLDARADAPVPDCVVFTIREALRLPADYPWCGRSSSGRGVHLWVRLTNVPSGNKKEYAAADGSFKHVEVRYGGGAQTVLPSLTGYGDALPTEPPADVTWEDLMLAVGHVADTRGSRQKPQESPRVERQPPAGQGWASVGYYATDSRDRYAAVTAENILSEMRSAQEGTRNDTLYRSAMKLERLVRAGRLSERIFDDLVNAAAAAGLQDSEIERSIASGRSSDNAQVPNTDGMPDERQPSTLMCSERTSAVAAQAESPQFPIAADDLAEIHRAIGELFEDSDSPPTFPTHLLPLPLREQVEAVAAAVEADAGLAATVGFAVLATVLQGKVWLNVQDSWQQHLNLYTLVLAGSGEGKSPTFRLMTQPLVMIQREFAEVFEQERTQVAQGLEALSKDDRKAARAELDTLDRRGMRRVFVSDTTTEALALLCRDNDEQMAVLSSEGDFFTVAAGLYTNGGRLPNLGILLHGFDGDPVGIARGKGNVYLNQPLLTLGVTAQPALLRGLPNRQMLMERGLLPRLLICCPPVNQNKTYRAQGVPQTVQTNYDTFVRSLWSSDGGAIPLTPAAYEAFTEFRRARDRRKQAMQHSDLRYFLNKADSQVLRLAGLLHAARMTYAGHCVRTPLPEATLTDAMTIAQYYERHTAYALAEMTAIAQVVKDARRVLLAIAKHWSGWRKQPDGKVVLSLGYITQKIRIDQRHAKEALTYLDGVGLIAQMNTLGKDSKKYTIQERVIFALQEQGFVPLQSGHACVETTSKGAESVEKQGTAYIPPDTSDDASGSDERTPVVPNITQHGGAENRVEGVEEIIETHLTLMQADIAALHDTGEQFTTLVRTGKTDEAYCLASDVHGAGRLPSEHFQQIRSVLKALDRELGWQR